MQNKIRVRGYITSILPTDKMTLVAVSVKGKTGLNNNLSFSFANDVPINFKTGEYVQIDGCFYSKNIQLNDKTVKRIALRGNKITRTKKNKDIKNNSFVFEGKITFIKESHLPNMCVIGIACNNEDGSSTYVNLDYVVENINLLNLSAGDYIKTIGELRTDRKNKDNKNIYINRIRASKIEKVM